MDGLKTMDVFTSYHDFIEHIVELSGLSHSQNHVHVGLFIYLTTQLMLGTRRAALPALLAVLAVELVHEALEAVYYGSLRVTDTSSDIALTLMWPALIFLSSYYRRVRWNVALSRRMSLAQRQTSWMPSGPLWG